MEPGATRKGSGRIPKLRNSARHPSIAFVRSSGRARPHVARSGRGKAFGPDGREMVGGRKKELTRRFKVAPTYSFERVEDEGRTRRVEEVNGAM